MNIHKSIKEYFLASSTRTRETEKVFRQAVLTIVFRLQADHKKKA